MNPVNRRLALLAMASLFASLVACGGGGSDGPASPGPAQATNYFPLDADSRWVYTTIASTQPVLTRVTGTQAVGGSTGTVVRVKDLFGGTDDVSVYVVAPNSVREYSTGAADAITRAFDGIEVMRLPARVGDSFQQLDTTIDSGQDFDGDGRSDRAELRAELTVVSTEAVATPAGTFNESLHQRQTLRVAILPTTGGAAFVSNFTIDTWYAPNVGVVKTISTVSGPGFNDTTTETLSAYRVGSRTNDSIAPTVQSVTPNTTPTSGLGTVVSAVFSETMDADSFVPGSFTVMDSANVPIAGIVAVQGNSARFVSGQAWATGSYTARIAAAQDLLGNPLAAPRSWTFTVDATAPGIVSSTPLDGANDVTLDSTIGLQFSEPPDPATVISSNVTLSDGFGSVPALLSVSGNRVTITPTGGLQRAKVYQVNVFNVADLAGNRMAQGYALQFRTTQGRFAYPTILFPGVSVDAMAIGDVNGDGINDIVMAPSVGNDVAYRNALYVRSGNADGTLAEPVRVDIGSQLSCSLDSIVIGDVNGDGRPDVVVGGNYCGAQVLHQTASGTLVPAEFLPQAASGKLRLADLDGDGRIDLVGAGGNSSIVNVWRQDATGTLVLSATPAIGIAFGRDIEIGDVNGDGRPDLIVATTGNVGQHVAVLLQAANGSFGPPNFLDTGSVWGATGLAVGDLNGDGRLDIVATTGGNSPTYIAVFYQGAGGVLGPATQIASYDIPMAVRVADFNNDGRADIVVSHQGWGAVGIYLQQAGGLLAVEERFAAPYGTYNPHSMAVGDINRDGLADIVIAGELIRQLPSTTGSAQRVPSGRSLGSVVRSARDRALTIGSR